MTNRMGLVLLSLALIGATGCAQPEPTAAPPSSPQSELKIILQPDLSQAQPAVRSQLEEEYDSLQALLSGAADSAELAEGFGDLGLLYVAYTFNSAAEDCFENARSLAPQDHRWHYLLGYLYQIQGRLEPGLESLEQAVDLLPDDQPSLLRLGQIELDQGNYEAAQEYFERVLAIEVQSAAALGGLGKVMAGLKDDKAAADLFERTLALQPTASSIHHALGLVYRNLGNRELAQDHLAKGGDGPVLFSDPLLQETTELGRSAEVYLVRGAQAFSEERYEAASGFYRQALEYDPKDFTTYKALGFSLEKLGDFEGAAEQLEIALRIATTEDADRDALERAEIYRILGGLTVLRGRPIEAAGYFQQAIDLNPKNLDARSKLANILARNRDFGKAIGQYNQILIDLPDHSKTLVRRASAYINLGQSQKAIADFERAVQLEPQNPEIRRLYVRALEFLGHTVEAQQQSLALQDLTKEGESRATLLAAEAKNLLRSGRVDAAIAALQEALELDRSLNDARYDLATAYGHVGRLDEAIGEFRVILEAAPLHGPSRRGEATALLLQQNYAEARIRLNQALKAMPRDHAIAQAYCRVLATAPDPRVRNGQLALDIASRIFADQQDPVTIETLALAYAETGDFSRGVQLLQELHDDLAQSGRTSELQNLEAEIESLESHRPWRASSPDEIIRAAFGTSPR
jgi:tetratricopeptide (TPR) repeat protein